MIKLKYILKEKKMLIIIISIILVCSIAIAFGVYGQITNKGFLGKSKEEVDSNYEELKSNFKDIFTNTINKETTAKLDINYDDIIYCAYEIKEEKNGKYNINARVPLFKLENITTTNINKEIFDTFARKILDITNNSTVYTTYSLDYVVYVNNNIISLVIRCKYKDGTNPQRDIIQTYNYDIENEKLLTIQDVLEYKSLDKNEVQNKIYKEIEKVMNEKQSMGQQGYNVYMRNKDDEIYKVENTANFFLGKNNYLYLVYAYGNNNFTSEKDLVIF